MADFWRTFHHEGKISIGWWGLEGEGCTPTPFPHIYHHVQLVLRILDVYPGSWFLPIPDLGNINKRERWKKICCPTLFCSHKFLKIVNYFIFEMPKKNMWASFQRIIELFTQKFVTKLSKIWVWDPRSGIRKKSYPGSGVKKALNTLNTKLQCKLKLRWIFMWLVNSLWHSNHPTLPHP